MGWGGSRSSVHASSQPWGSHGPWWVGVQEPAQGVRLGVGVEGSVQVGLKPVGTARGAGLFSTRAATQPPNGKHGYQSAAGTRAGQREGALMINPC